MLPVTPKGKFKVEMGTFAEEDWTCDVCETEYSPDSMPQFTCSQCFEHRVCAGCTKECQCQGHYETCTMGYVCNDCYSSLAEPFKICTLCPSSGSGYMWCGNTFRFRGLGLGLDNCCCFHFHLKNNHLELAFAQTAESLWEGFSSPLNSEEWYAIFKEAMQTLRQLAALGAPYFTFRRCFREVVMQREQRVMRRFDIALATMYAKTAAAMNLTFDSLPRLTDQEWVSIFNVIIIHSTCKLDEIPTLKQAIDMIEERALFSWGMLDGDFKELPDEIKRMIVLKSILPSESQFNLLLA